MARIFTIFFEYEGATYNAMIAVREAQCFTEYVLKFLDDSLLRQLPSNKLVASGSGTLTFASTQMQPPSQLMKSIARAVSGHLQLSGI